MAFAISVKASGKTAARLRDYWSRFSQFESKPSMIAHDYPPHVTLAIYDQISGHRLRETLALVFGGGRALRLRFNKLSYFEKPRLVFWAAPARSRSLLDAHAAIHRLIDPSLCREHYQPGKWVPHSTLATAVSPSNKAAAIALASQAIDPFEVVFDKADCIEFQPIRVIEERHLSTAS